MKVTLSEAERQELLRIADMEDIDSDKLLERYTEDLGAYFRLNIMGTANDMKNEEQDNG